MPVVCGVVVKSLSPASNVIYVCREQSGGDHVESHTLKEQGTTHMCYCMFFYATLDNKNIVTKGITL